MFDKLLYNIGEVVVKTADAGVSLAKSIKNKYIPQTTNIIANKLKDINIEQTKKEIKEKISTVTEHIVDDVKSLKEKVTNNVAKTTENIKKTNSTHKDRQEKKAFPAFIRNGLPLKRCLPKFVEFPAKLRHKTDYKDNKCESSQANNVD